MNDFYTSGHCDGEALCFTCRNLKNGRKFRLSIMGAFSGLAKPDFDCPKNHPWGYNIIQKINDLPNDSDNAKCLKALAAQIEDLMGKPGIKQCRSSHLAAKLLSYYAEYKKTEKEN